MERSYKELSDETEEAFYSILRQNKKWKVGGRFVDPYWRIIINSQDLTYDILLPGLFKTEKEAIYDAKGIMRYLSVKAKGSWDV
jgi:hypothetical protein